MITNLLKLHYTSEKTLLLSFEQTFNHPLSLISYIIVKTGKGQNRYISYWLYPFAVYLITRWILLICKQA